MTEEERTEVLAMWDGGARVADIHHTLGLKYTTVYWCVRKERRVKSARRYRGRRFHGTERLPSNEFAKTAFMYERLGMSTREIGEALGKSRDTIAYRLNRAGVKLRPRGDSVRLRWQRRGRRPITPSRWPELTQRRLDQTAALYALELTSAQVGEVMGLAGATVRYRLHKNGVELRRGRSAQTRKACYTWSAMDNVDQRIALVFLENDHGTARTSSLLPNHPLCQELGISESPLLAEFDDGARVIIQQDGGIIPLQGEKK